MKKLLLLALIGAITMLEASSISTESIRNSIQNSIDSKLSGRNKDIVKTIYKKSDYKPLWVGSSNTSRQTQLIKALNNPLYNYKNKPMGRKKIKYLFYMLDNNEISAAKKIEVYARLDIMLSNSYVSLVRFIVQGDVDWSLVKKKMTALKASDDIQAKWEFSPKGFPSQDTLYSSISGGNIYGYLNSLIPMEIRYKDLIKMLKDYRVMSKYPKIAYTNEIFKLGDRDKRILEIKKRLKISGDLPKSAKLNKKFDMSLQQAVLTYQRRYNLKVDGKIDKVMTYYLNLPAKKNIQQIIANLDKCKLYPKKFENEYAEVNIPDFNLRYYRNGQRLFKTGIVVGRIDRPTPIFSDEITYMVLNPTWTVTDNLVKRDLIPTIREQPNYLQEHNIHVFSGNKEVTVTIDDLAQYENSSRHVPYRFVQYPGDSNALGRIKFMFPNKYAVYLHDTDNKSLLERRYKIYSSGCMRVDKPFDFMKVLLPNVKENYSQDRIQQILDSMKTTTIRLKRAIPVHIIYFTVYREDGLAYFKNDIYLYDQMIWESSAGHKKATFKIPSKRFIDVKKNAGRGTNEPNTEPATQKRDRTPTVKKRESTPIPSSTHIPNNSDELF
ncbi:MAG: L,D-transpeptidase family protein [Campylobacterota bacterium]|nr:L,D-transpeptidase family protein [Campylobacterota bacterium]